MTFPSPKTDGSLSRLLLHRAGFILGPGYAEAERFAHWQRIKVHRSAYLIAHPDLNVQIMRQDKKSITLLGYIIDPEQPQASNLQILESLMGRIGQGGTAQQYTAGMGGRWILIVDDGHGLKLFNDAAGLRQVFYTYDDATDGLWCASQPVMLAKLLDRPITAQAEAFINSFEFRSNTEFRWPAEGSPFENISHLLPNHELDITTGQCRRYFPDGPLQELTVETAADRIAEKLSTLMAAAAQRFELALSLTAGLDSRMVLAAARSIQNNIRIMTVRQIDKPDTHMDVAVAAGLAAENGLKHDLVASSLIIDDGFAKIFHQNARPAHYIYLPDAFAIFKRYGLQRVAVTGSVSEIGRLSFRKQLGKPETEAIDARDLAKLQKMGRHPYAVSAFKRWLGSLKGITDIPLLDLFEWEQGHGNWLAMCQSEFDIAWQDIFSPFNCRQILTTMLAVPAKHRKGPGHDLFINIIRKLWPELLEVPINPGEQERVRPIEQLKAAVPYPVKEYVKSALKKETVRIESDGL